MYLNSRQRKFVRINRIIASTFALVVFAASHPATAQEEVWPSNAEAHPGEIVYSRDVPYGTATRRFAQGEASTVVPDQSRLIQDSLLIGLKPISDAEQASVSAPLGRALNGMHGSIDIGLSALSNSSGSSGFVRSENGASTTGGIVRQGLSILPSALGAIADSAGSGQ